MDTAPIDTLIRRASPDDADGVAVLSGELGYPADTVTMRRRLERLGSADEHVVFVACRDGRIVGWIHVSLVEHLQAEPRAEIGGLVVAADARSGRIGARLVAEAEGWAITRGIAGMVVRSQIARDAAHRFYLREGYERTKTSAVFSKMLHRATVDTRQVE